jgi:hypothetical protein
MKGDGWRASVPWVWSISDERGVYSYDSYLFSADLIPSRDKIIIMKDCYNLNRTTASLCASRRLRMQESATAAFIDETRK